MAMVVKNNMSAIRTLNTLNNNSTALQKSLAKVSSGMKINSAQDDASGYAISERMRVQIRSLDQANQNTQNASSLMKTAEGAVSSTVEILKSLKEKAINAATDTNTDSDRATIQKEIDQFIDQIDDNALTTFNGKYLVDGSKSQQGKATHTAFTNQSLATDTKGTTKLTDLENRNNENLEIKDTDYVTASFVSNGKTYTTKFLVGDNTLDNVFGNMNSTYLTANGLDPDTDADKAAFAGTASSTTSTSNTNTNTAPDTTTTLADVATARTALKTAIDASNSYQNDMNNNAKTYIDEYVDTLAATQSDNTVSDYVAPSTSVTWADSNGNKFSDLNAANQGYVTAALAESAVATAVNNLKSAITTHNNAVNGVSPSTAAASNFKAVDGTGIDKSNADSYIMDSDAVDELASTYGVSRYENESDEDYAARILEAAIDKGTENNDPSTRGAANAVTYATGTLNEASDPTGIGQTQTGAALYFNPEDILAYDSNGKLTGAMQESDDTAGSEKGAAALQAGYDAYVADNALSSGSGANIATPYAAAVKLANHLSALNAKNANETGIVGTVTTGDSKPTSGAFGLEQSTDNTYIGVDSSGDAVNTADGTAGLTVTANASGIEGQISGVTISISDSEGNVKKSANAALDAFKTTIYAKNESAANELSFQVGASANQSIAVGLDDMRSEALGLKGSDGTKVSVATQDKANAAVAVFDNALQKVLDQQATIGAIEARLEYTSSNLTTSSENVQAAESTIRDADMAKEMTNYTKNNVLLQAAQSMLAQANQNSSAVLSLLQ